MGDVIGIMGVIGLIAAGVGYAWSQYRKGKDEGTAATTKNQTDLLALHNEQIEGYKKVIAEDREQFKAYELKFAGYEKKFAVMDALMQEKDKKLAEYLQIFQNKNPQMEEFIKLGTEVIQESRKWMETNKDDMKELRTEIKDTRRMIMAQLQNSHVNVINNPTAVTERRKDDGVEATVVEPVK